MQDYPDSSDIKTIKEWDAVKDPFGLIDFIESITWDSDWCIKIKGKRVRRFEFHTGGWSGNEEIIGALSENEMFFTLYWQKTTRGGHHYFCVKKLK